MALGTPVVATSVGGVPDLIEHQTSGVLVGPGDSTALAEAVFHVATDPTGALRLAQNAHKRLVDYSPEKQTQQLIQLYLKALSRSETRSASSSVPLPIDGYQMDSTKC
jgi:glycosyltransferase involved in cell wall biosynthesis